MSRRTDAAKRSQAKEYAPTFGRPNVFSREGQALAIEDVWPSLYIGADRVAEMTRKVRRLAWAKAALARWVDEAEAILAEPPRFPKGETTGRCHMYFTDLGQHLLFDPSQCRRMWDPFRRIWVKPTTKNLGAWRLLCHERLRRLMGSLGFLYRLTGDERYSRWVWQALEHSVLDLYGRKVAARRKNGVVYGGLYEAQSMLQHVQALELVASAPGETDAIRQRVEQEILSDVGEALSRWMDVMIVFNMSCWTMAALAELGRYLDRPEWIDKALHSKRTGLVKMLKTGLPRDRKTGRADGFWFETATFYGIFYALTSLISLYRTGKAAGLMNADLKQRFESMFDAPLHLADEHLRMLAVSDRVAPDWLNLTDARHVYEYAAGQVSLKKYGPVLAMLYDRCGADRSSLAALAWGPNRLPPAGRPPSRSVVLPSAKMVTFRGRTKRGPVTCWFLAGEDNAVGQGHHHHDKLSVSLHAYGEIITSDLGLPGSQDNAWASFLNSSFSHNTLMVNERAQGPMRSATFEADVRAKVPFARSTVVGDRLSNARRQLWKVMAVQRRDEVTEDLCDGVKFSRAVYFDPPYIFLADACEAPEERRFEFVLHANGSMVTQPAPADAARLQLPPLPKKQGFSLFTGRASANPIAQITVDWRIRGDLWLRLVAASDGPFEATWGTTPANPRDLNRGTVLLRAPGRKRRYAAVLELHHGTPTVQTVAVRGRRGLEMTRFDGRTSVHGA